MKQHRTLRWGVGILLALTMGLCLLAATALADTQQTADFTIADGSVALSRLTHNNQGRAEWDNTSKTLTLKGVNYALTAATAVKLPAGSTIVLEDGTENTITNNSSSESTSDSYGILVEGGDLTIKGSGTLTVTGGAATGGSVGISVTGNLTITDGTVNANGGGNSGSSTGINAGGSVGITSATVTATGSDSTNNSYGIYARGVEISGSTVTATGGDAETGDSVGIWTNAAVTISGDDTVVTATGGTASSDSHGIWTSFDNVTISGGTVTVTGSNADDSYGIRAGWEQDIIINGGHVTAKTLATTATNKSALHVEGTNGGALDLSGYDNYQWCTSDGGDFTTTPYTYSATDTYVEFKPGPITCTVSFDKNTGSGTMDDVTVVSGSEYTLPVCTFTAPVGEKFGEWRVNSKGYNVGDTIKITEDTNVIALWVDIPAITGNQTADFTIGDDSTALKLLNDAKTGTAESTWDSATKTLTLNGVNFTTSADIAVKLPGGSTIVLAGGTKNTITSTSVSSNPSDSCQGIRVVEGDLTIEGSGELAVKGGGTLSSSGISVFSGFLAIESGTVSFTGNTASSGSYGVYTDKGVIISGGIVNATGGKVNGAHGSSFGISTNQSVTVTGGTVTARGDDGGKTSYGIQTGTSSADTFTVTGGDVTAIGGNASERSCGIQSKYIKISGGHVIAQTLSNASTEYRSALPSAPDLSDYDGYQWRTSDGGAYTPSSTTQYTYSDTHTYVEFSQGPITYTVSFNANGGSGTMSSVTGVSGSYTLPACGFTAPSGQQFKAWSVNDTEYAENASITVNANTTVTALWEAIPAITGDETADFTNDADAALQLLTNGDPSKATWDSVTKTLTLKGVSFTTTAATAVKLPAGTIIELVGDNTIASTNTDRTVRESYGIDGVGNLTIGGSGTLTVTGGAAELPSRGIYARNNITITGGTVNANGGANASSSVGIFADTVAEIRGGKVTATGGKADKASTGIVALDVAITGGTVNATGNTTNQDSSGIYANNGVTISGADAVVTATGGNAESDSHGIWADYGDVAISGCSVKATGNTADDSYGIYARTENIKISGGHVIARTLATTAARNRSALSKAPDLSGYPDCYWRTGPDDIYYNTAYPYSLAHTYVELTGESKTVLNADDLPRTGDDSSILLWTVLLLASVLGVTGTVVYSKRSKYAK